MPTQPTTRTTPPPRSEIPAARPGEAAPEPQAAPTPSTPTPTQAENDAYVEAMLTGTLPHVVHHKQDGSPIDQSSFDPTPGTPTWP